MATRLLWYVMLFVIPIVSHSRAANSATLVVRGGRVWTGQRESPWAETVAIQGKHILAVGTALQIERLVDDATTIVDARGGLIMPGWIDAHIHLLAGGRNLSSVQLRDAASRAEFVRRVGDFAATLDGGEWITGGDWDHTRWGGQLPHRSWLDEVTPKNPVWIQRLDGHMALANSLALAQAGVDHRTSTPVGGEIERGDDGQPTGILRDNAMDLVSRFVPAPTTTRQLEALVAATQYLHARGVTSVHHMGTLGDLRLLRTAHQADKLRLRVYAATPLPEWELLRAEIDENGRGDQWLGWGALKGFVDGSLGSRTAAFMQAFVDAPGDRGLLVNTPEDLYHWTAKADAAGLQVMVHAIGDRANRLQLDVFARVARENGPRDRRFRIEHAQHIAPADLSRFAELGVIASMQPYHAIDDGRWAEGAIGLERCKTTYAFRSLLDYGTRLAFGSDWFVAPPTPLEGIYAAVTRRTLDGNNPQGWIAEQRIAVGEALRAYTVDAAYASFDEHIKGTLEPGKLADMVIVDRDLFTIDPADIHNAQVICTILDGQIVYSAKNRSQ